MKLSFCNRSLGTKFSIIVISIALITIGAATYVYTNIQQKIFLEHLETKARMLGDFVSLISPDSILSYDFETMNGYMHEISVQEDMIYSVLISKNGTNLTNYLNKDNKYIAAEIKTLGTDDFDRLTSHIDESKSAIIMSFPITFEGKSLGKLKLAVSHGRIDEYLKESLIQIVWTSAAILAFLIACIFISFRSMAIQPIQSLNQAVRRVASGNLDEVVDIQSHDEIGSLTEAFNEMVKRLKQNISEKDNMALHLHNQADELRELHQEALMASKAKSMFLANMSHELRTPLNAILGYSELLGEDAKDEGKKDTVRDLGHIHDAGHHLLSLINDVLDLSKIEAGKIELKPETFEMATLVNDMSAMVQPLIESNRNEFDIKIKAKVGSIYADKIRVRQLLFNLLSNACKFTQDGVITLSAERMEIANKNWLKISVTDTGIGIHPDKIGKLFKPFTQVDESFTRRYGGTGLGLTICKRYCEMMGGEISVTSSPGKGSTFTIRLPASPQEKIQSVAANQG